MLHRTQAKQVVMVYEQFISLYPTLEAVAHADEQRVQAVLKPLGLHWRINGMINALSHLWAVYREVPLDREKLMSVEGIGAYIAGATICFTGNEPVALIDTNTVRVIGRLFGLDLSGEARRRKEVIRAIADSTDPARPRDYYYAMIDLAHHICTARSPACHKCPLFDLPCTYGNNRPDLATT